MIAIRLVEPGQREPRPVHLVHQDEIRGEAAHERAHVGAPAGVPELDVLEAEQQAREVRHCGPAVGDDECAHQCPPSLVRPFVAVVVMLRPLLGARGRRERSGAARAKDRSRCPWSSSAQYRAAREPLGGCSPFDGATA
jgi:hypothetical protein